MEERGDVIVASGPQEGLFRAESWVLVPVASERDGLLLLGWKGGKCGQGQIGKTGSREWRERLARRPVFFALLERLLLGASAGAAASALFFRPGLGCRCCFKWGRGLDVLALFDPVGLLLR